MANIPNVQLLESMHAFPGTYVFKVIGEDDNSFPGRVMAAIHGEVPEALEPAISTKRTSSGRHVSVTIEPVVMNADQVIAIYQRLYELEGLVMVL